MSVRHRVLGRPKVSSAPSASPAVSDRREKLRAHWAFELDFNAWLFIIRDVTRLQFARELTEEERTELRGAYIDDTHWHECRLGTPDSRPAHRANRELGGPREAA